MRRQRNPGVVYSGLVGAKMRPKRARRPPVQMCTVSLLGGPLAGKEITLEGGVPYTFEFTLHGQTGRYMHGKWEAKQ